jgi:hypothetical protein
MMQVILGRVVSGVGGSGLMVLAMLIITGMSFHAFPDIGYLLTEST